jgi:septal ring factor EnvC (AmiA/AmiB activator)
MEDSSILKLIGLNDKNKWILQDDQAKLFLEYVANNLDSSNILTDSEINEFELLKANGNVLDVDDLQNELKEVEMHFPGFLSVDDDTIEMLESQIKSLDNELSERNDRIRRMQEAKSAQLNEILDMERKNQNLRHQNEILVKDCLEKTHVLSKYQKSNLEKVDHLTQLYLQPVNIKF